MELSSLSFDFFKLLSLNQISFQDHLYISSINLICILVTLYRNGIFFNKAIKIQKLLFLFSFDYFYFHHIIFPIKSSYSLLLYYYLLNIYPLVIIRLYIDMWTTCLLLIDDYWCTIRISFTWIYIMFTSSIDMQ